MKTLLLLLSFFITSCNILLDTDESATPLSEDCSELEGKATKVLFIGNSYLSLHNIPKLFNEISCSKSLKTEVFVRTEHNYRFLDHASDLNTQGVINLKKWDIVVLQNQGQVPAWNSDQFESESLPYANALADMIYAKNPEAKIIYFQTWGRFDGDQTNCATTPLVCDLAGHTQALAEGYEAYADETGGEVAYVGNAFLEVHEDINEIIPSRDLWDQDGAHSSAIGSYLAANVLYAKITTFSPVGAISAEGLSRVESLYLQSVAAQVAGP